MTAVPSFLLHANFFVCVNNQEHILIFLMALSVAFQSAKFVIFVFFQLTDNQRGTTIQEKSRKSKKKDYVFRKKKCIIILNFAISQFRNLLCHVHNLSIYLSLHLIKLKTEQCQNLFLLSLFCHFSFCYNFLILHLDQVLLMS